MNWIRRSRGRDARYLRIYVNDHRAGAAGGIALAGRCARNNRSSALGVEMRNLVAELHSDQESLARIARHLKVAENPAKRLVMRLGEASSRWKFNGRLVEYSPLSRLLELELLLAGIDAKRSLWSALKSGAVSLPSDIDLNDLEHRASDQRARLRPYHREAAECALAGYSKGWSAANFSPRTIPSG